MKPTKILGLSLLLGIAAMLSGCPGGGVGACVSSPVSYTYFISVYCYSNFDSSECADYSAQDINGGAPWYFYSGQTCADRGLNEGSNYL